MNAEEAHAVYGWADVTSASDTYNITDSNGDIVANVFMVLDPSAPWVNMTFMSNGAYALQITTPGSVSTLMLIEFLLCVELLRFSFL